MPPKRRAAKWGAAEQQQQKRARSELVELVRKLTGISAKAKAGAAQELRKRLEQQSGDEMDQRIADAGAIAPLVALLQEDDVQCKRKAARALGSLAAVAPAASSIRADFVLDGAIPQLMVHLISEDDYIRDHCRSALDGLKLTKVEHLSLGSVQLLRHLLSQASVDNRAVVQRFLDEALPSRTELDQAFPLFVNRADGGNVTGPTFSRL